MQKEVLYQVVKDGKMINKFDFDELGLTWGGSYIRFVSGSKEIFHSPEHFYLSLIRTVEMHTCLSYGLSHWQFKVDLLQWCSGLKIEEISKSKFSGIVEGSLEEIDEHKDDNKDLKEYEFDDSKIMVPTEILKYWRIKETRSYRHRYGPTIGDLVETVKGYFYIEWHEES